MEFFLDARLKFLRMVAEAVFDDGCAVVRFRIFFPFSHEESFMELMKKDEWTFFFGEGFLDPDFPLGNPGVDTVVTAGVVFEENEITNEFSVDDPNSELIGAIGSEVFPVDFFNK